MAKLTYTLALLVLNGILGISIRIVQIKQQSLGVYSSALVSSYEIESTDCGKIHRVRRSARCLAWVLKSLWIKASVKYVHVNKTSNQYLSFHPSFVVLSLFKGFVGIYGPTLLWICENMLYMTGTYCYLTVTYARCFANALKILAQTESGDDEYSTSGERGNGWERLHSFLSESV